MAEASKLQVSELDFAQIREIETFATAPLLDLGVYPRALAWDTTEFLKTAESRNISFATMFR